jgi:hypothetical protein
MARQLDRASITSFGRRCDNYADLGATIVAPDADKNLGLRYFLNGALVSDIVVDTSRVATDTIDYVATDPTGRIATSTQTNVAYRRARGAAHRLDEILPEPLFSRQNTTDLSNL